jgi:peptidoglycan/xylan/chitin deacetylase (PgdA/CDA1 family)
MGLRAGDDRAVARSGGTGDDSGRMLLPRLGRRRSRTLLALLTLLVMPMTADAAASPAAASPAAASSAGASPAAASTAHAATRTTVPVVRHGPRTRSVVALTFDDCRDREPVLALVRELRYEGVPATFFPYGYAVRRNPTTWRVVAADGFPIGNHTLSHRDLVGLTERGVRYQLRQMRRVVDPLIGTATIPYARPPYGRYDATTRHAAALEGYRALVLWDVDTRDWAGASPGGIVKRATRGTNGSIVLMHCGPAATIAALPRIIAAFRARGMGFVTIPELLEGTGPPAGRGRIAPPGSPRSPS